MSTTEKKINTGRISHLIQHLLGTNPYGQAETKKLHEALSLLDNNGTLIEKNTNTRLTNIEDIISGATGFSDFDSWIELVIDTNIIKDLHSKAFLHCTGTHTHTLPTPTPAQKNVVYFFFNGGTGVTTINSGAALISGFQNRQLSQQYDFIKILGTGTAWYVIG